MQILGLKNKRAWGIAISIFALALIFCLVKFAQHERLERWHKLADEPKAVLPEQTITPLAILPEEYERAGILPHAEFYNQRAKDYASSGHFAVAEAYLRAVIGKRDAKNFAAYNNLGNLYLLQDRLDSAAVNYGKALPLAKTVDDSLGILLNCGVLFSTTPAVALAEQIFAEAIHDSCDLARAGRLLGINFLSTAGDDQSDQVSAAEIKKLALLAVDSNTKKKKSGGPQKPKKRDGKERTRDGMKKAEKELKQYQWVDTGKESFKPVQPNFVNNGGVNTHDFKITTPSAERSPRLGLALYWAN